MPYTRGVWQVKPGRADDFVAGWTESAEQTSGIIEGAGRATLPRDTVDSDRFVTFGPWETLGAIGSWRAADGWQPRLMGVRELLERFERATPELVAEVG